MSKIIKHYDQSGKNLSRFERNMLEDPDIAAAEELEEEPVEEETEEERRARLEAEAAYILDKTRAEAEQKVQEAYAEGLRRGEEAGREAFLASVEESSAVLAGINEELKRARQALNEQLIDNMGHLVRAITQRVLFREVETDSAAIRRVLQAVFEHLADRERVVIQVHPDDLKILEQETPNFFDKFDSIRQKQIIANEDISRGGCTVEVDSIYVDAQIEAQLGRILDGLTELDIEASDT